MLTDEDKQWITDALAAGLDRTNQYVAEFRHEMIQRLDELDLELNMTTAWIAAMERQLHPYTQATASPGPSRDARSRLVIKGDL